MYSGVAMVIKSVYQACISSGGPAHGTTTERWLVFICFTQCSLILIPTLRLHLRAPTTPLTRLTASSTLSPDATPALARCRPACLLALPPCLPPFPLRCLHCYLMLSNEPTPAPPTRDEDGSDGYDEVGRSSLDLSPHPLSFLDLSPPPPLDLSPSPPLDLRNAVVARFQQALGSYSLLP